MEGIVISPAAPNLRVNIPLSGDASCIDNSRESTQHRPVTFEAVGKKCSRTFYTYRHAEHKREGSAWLLLIKSLNFLLCRSLLSPSEKELPVPGDADSISIKRAALSQMNFAKFDRIESTEIRLLRLRNMLT